MTAIENDLDALDPARLTRLDAVPQDDPWYEPDLACLDGHWDDPCVGTVEYRYALSATGKSFPRCDKHWDERLDAQEGINRRYGHPDSNCGAPSDFDPSYAGEYWDEDY